MPERALPHGVHDLPGKTSTGSPMTTELSPQVSRLRDELLAASEKAAALVRSSRPDRLTARPAPDGWSAVECLIHLNLTSKQYIPLIHTAIQLAEQEGKLANGSFHLDWKGRLLAWFLEPPYRMRGKTIPHAIPDRPRPPEPVLEEFTALNRQLIEMIEVAAPLAMNEIRIVSPFNGKASYNLFATFHVVAAHERRHLWQAGKALASL
jgi:hypothetical protein